jgi:hypothetical protein
MGSALCFPVLATVVWAILAAGLPDANMKRKDREAFISHILVYGDDVVVPTAHAVNATKLLESFGLKVNYDKSCISGLFRESCGMDAYKGIPVTPVRLRTVWSSSRRPDVYTSWIAYANQFWYRQYYNTYNTIVEKLLDLYREIPDETMSLTCPSLVEVPEEYRPKRRRNTSRLANRANDYQRLEYYVWDVRPRRIKHTMCGWKMLLRYFAEAHSKDSLYAPNDNPRRSGVGLLTFSDEREAFSVSSYTKRGSNSLIHAWR